MAKLHVYVYRNDLGDSTNGGITSNVKSILLCTSKEEAVEEMKKGVPALYLENRNLSHGMYKTAYPGTSKPNGHVGYMAGGNFVYTSDSRFSEYFGTSYPIPVHDRSETQEEYNILSR
jgi:hypothetical protein